MTQRIKYILSDLIASALGWFVFYIYRFDLTAHNDFDTLQDFLLSRNVMLNLSLTPLLWLCLFWFSGYYYRPYFKNMLEELQKTFMTVVLGSLLFFFLYVIDDVPLFEYEPLELTSVNHVPSSVYFEIIVTMITDVFVPVYIGRLLITSRTGKAIRNGEVKFDILDVGNSQMVKESIAKGRNVPDAFILQPKTRVPKVVFGLVYDLMPFGKPILLKADANDLLTGQVKTSSITRVPMIEYCENSLSPFDKNIKRLFDFLFSALCLIVCSPLMLIIALLIKKDSHGPVFYRQERLGLHTKPYTILKFRTMYEDAEHGTPQLSTIGDTRVTHIGAFLRKYRLDELPQLWNILVGEMSFVGPRPERRYYVDQIMEVAPHYVKLYQVKPGLTSWGMVKYGYASDLFQMVERMRYDIMYIDNISLLIDIKIMAYTIKTVITGKGI